MLRYRYFSLSAVVVLSGVLMLVVAGCGGPSSVTKTDAPQPSHESHPPADVKPATMPNPAPAESVKAVAAAEGDHAHKAGSHGGIIVPIGSDSHHAEVVVERTGEFRLLTLGKDEARIQEVDVQVLKAYIKVVGQLDALPVELAATPQDGDAPGKTSQFMGLLPEELRGRPLEVTIPNLRINGERFRVGFTTASAAHPEEMPARLPDAEERALYLEPAGKYTAEDIRANGSMTAAHKFQGILSSHDMKPKVGDRICPVTLTKANPKFTWIIDGKPYEFCCPPCVDEFVKTAKQQPDEVKPPETYIK